MGFWSGFEGLTGHQPGAFKGFSLKDIIDKDLWERRERKFPSPRYAEEGLDAPTTAWYKGMGRPEMMGPRVGAADVSSGAQPRMGVGRDRPFPITPRQQPRMAIGRDRPFPMADKKTVKKIFADPNKSDEIIETIEEKVPTGSAQWGNSRHPPNWLQRMDEGYFGRPTTFSSPMQPEGALTSSAQPTSIMNMFNMKALQDLARRKWEERMRARGGY